jgi:hypothetical protein
VGLFPGGIKICGLFRCRCRYRGNLALHVSIANGLRLHRTRFLNKSMRILRVHELEGDILGITTVVTILILAF